MIPPDLVQLVRDRAHDCCEYCRVPEKHSTLRFHVEHVIPRVHGGASEEENLALACPECNWHKGTNLTGIDPDTGLVTGLFHPRKHAWTHHFTMQNGRVIARTPEARTTLWLLQMNSSERVRSRILFYGSTG
jgi:hypothetical protein